MQTIAQESPKGGRESRGGTAQAEGRVHTIAKESPKGGVASRGPDQARGSRAAFTEAYRAHVHDVYAFFSYSRIAKEDVEDLTQATFERALRAWHRFNPATASAKTWLLCIARNLLIDHHRRLRRRPQVPLTDAHQSQLRQEAEPFAAGGGTGKSAFGCHADDGARALPFGDQAEERLLAALASLSQREREVIALRFGGELSGPEIASLLRLSLANVQQIASRALRRLRAELEDSQEAADPARPARDLAASPAQQASTPFTSCSQPACRRETLIP